MKLWQTKGGTQLDPLIEKFTVGNDLQADEYLIEYDCLASTVHAYQLLKKKQLTRAEFAKVKQALKAIFDCASRADFRLQAGDEDGHSAIENILTKKCGELGGKIHLGRSRNDQSATAIRLFAKHKVMQLGIEVLSTIDGLLALAKKYAKVPMPGYTHARPAMVSSVGHFFAAFAEVMLDDYRAFDALSGVIDSCPLGAAAGYGSTVPSDRRLTARLLGFARVQINTLSTQITRGKLESRILGALTNIGLTLSRLANDLIYFAGPEYDFFSLTDNVATGSSIMPQKRNPDLLEIMRGNTGLLLGYYVQTATIVKGLPAGYQRDLQLTKKPFIDGMHISSQNLKALQILLKNLVINEQQLRDAAGNPHLFAAQFANDLVLEKGLSFRDAYRKVKIHYTRASIDPDAMLDDDLPNFDPDATLQHTTGLGMPGNLALGITIKTVASEKKKITARIKTFESTLNKVWQL